MKVKVLKRIIQIFTAFCCLFMIYVTEVNAEKKENEKDLNVLNIETQRDVLHGLILVEEQWKYYENGTWVSDKYDFVDYNGGRFLVANGMVANLSGLVEYKGVWYFLTNGQLINTYSGLAEYDGEWFYVVDGILQSDFNGIQSYDGSKFLIAEGRILYEYSGLFENADGVWYFIANGQVQTKYSGLALYDEQWFYVANGVLAVYMRDCVYYDGSYFRVVDGMVVGEGHNYINGDGYSYCELCNSYGELLMTGAEKETAGKVKHLSDCYLYTRDWGYELNFKLKDAEYNPLKSPATVTMLIYNNNDEMVYRSIKPVTRENWATDAGGYDSYSMARIPIMDYEIAEGSSTVGYIVFYVENGEYFAFDEQKIKIDNLPLKEPEISFSELPLMVYNYR